MAKLTFKAWLLAQTGRADQTGIFARHVQADSDFPDGPVTPMAYSRYLISCKAKMAYHAAFSRAWNEYEESNGG